MFVLLLPPPVVLGARLFHVLFSSVYTTSTGLGEIGGRVTDKPDFDPGRSGDPTRAARDLTMARKSADLDSDRAGRA
jgi:hypothetical protein